MRRLSLNRSEPAKKSGQNIPKNRCRIPRSAPAGTRLTHMLPLAAQLARKARSLSSGSQKVSNFFETILAIGD